MDELLLLSGDTASPEPSKDALRAWAGNMCGVRVGGLRPVPGGAADPSLVLSWFYDRYDDGERVLIRGAWRSRHLTHVDLSWPDSRAMGFSASQFAVTCAELIQTGFYPNVFLCSKDFDPSDPQAIIDGCEKVIAACLSVGVRIFTVGWELSIWLSPAAVQVLIDAFAARVVPKALLYVHFQAGYFAFQKDHGVTADFWNAQVGKLTGVLHQKPMEWDDVEWPARVVDCLQRFSGQFGFVRDSGFGHPFDFVVWEVSAMNQFAGSCSEEEGNRIARLALSVPPINGVRVMGSGNGH